MSRSWCRGRVSGSQGRLCFRPRIELLEDRCVPSVSTGPAGELALVLPNEDQGHALPVQAVAQRAFAGPVAAVRSAAAVDASIAIDWGDGSLSNGRLADAPADAPQGWSLVLGAHTYTEAGLFRLTITLRYDQGEALIVGNQAMVFASVAVVVSGMGGSYQGDISLWEPRAGSGLSPSSNGGMGGGTTPPGDAADPAPTTTPPAPESDPTTTPPAPDAGTTPPPPASGPAGPVQGSGTPPVAGAPFGPRQPAGGTTPLSGPVQPAQVAQQQQPTTDTRGQVPWTPTPDHGASRVLLVQVLQGVASVPAFEVRVHVTLVLPRDGAGLQPALPAPAGPRFVPTRTTGSAEPEPQEEPDAAGTLVAGARQEPAREPGWEDVAVLVGPKPAPVPSSEADDDYFARLRLLQGTGPVLAAASRSEEEAAPAEQAPVEVAEARSDGWALKAAAAWLLFQSVCAATSRAPRSLLGYGLRGRRSRDRG